MKARKVFLLLLFVLPAVAATADAQQCRPGMPCYQPPAQYGQPSQAAPPQVVRVRNDADGTTGTGVIVDDDGERALVVSVAHLFRAGSGTVTVTGQWGSSIADFATVDRDHADVSAVTIPSPGIPPMPIATSAPQAGEVVTIKGFGRGSYAEQACRWIGQDDDLVVTGAGREGDSGAPVCNSRGELVGIQWGSDGQTIRGTCLPRILPFLDRVRLRIAFAVRRIVAPAWEPPTRPALPAPPVPIIPAPVPIVPPAPTPIAAEPPAVSVPDKIEQAPALIASKAHDWSGLAFSAASTAAPWVLGALGVGTGAGVPIVAWWLAAKGLGGLAALRRRKRQQPKEQPAVQAEPFSPQAAGTGSWPRDATEALQYLQLSRAEGRDPISDALIGRAALDRLDERIESSTDYHEREWATNLKHELLRVFNQMMPPAVTMPVTGE